MPGTAKESPLMTTREVAEYLRCSLSGVYGMIESGVLRAVKIGRSKGRHRISRVQVEALASGEQATEIAPAHTAKPKRAVKAKARRGAR